MLVRYLYEISGKGSMTRWEIGPIYVKDLYKKKDLYQTLYSKIIYNIDFICCIGIYHYKRFRANNQ